MSLTWFRMFKNLRKKPKKGMYYGPTDGRTDRPTDIAISRAPMELKIKLSVDLK